MPRVAYTEFGKAVREHDQKRLIFTGDSLPRPAAWHMEKEGSWTPDNERQFRQMLRSLNPDPIDAISIHAYGEDAERIAWGVQAAQSIKKPLFIGEFGVPGTGPEVEKNSAACCGSSKSPTSRWPRCGSSTCPVKMPTTTSPPTTRVPTNSAISPQPTPAFKAAGLSGSKSRFHERAKSIPTA
jgi:hypothetical protein